MSHLPSSLDLKVLGMLGTKIAASTNELFPCPHTLVPGSVGVAEGGWVSIRIEDGVDLLNSCTNLQVPFSRRGGNRAHKDLHKYVLKGEKVVEFFFDVKWCDISPLNIDWGPRQRGTGAHPVAIWEVRWDCNSKQCTECGFAVYQRLYVHSSECLRISVFRRLDSSSSMAVPNFASNVIYPLVYRAHKNDSCSISELGSSFKRGF
jgi:hypothetical protein